MKTAVETTRLSRRYRSTWALRDCSLTIPAGRVVALVGPNGAGKTTLLRLCAALDKPTAGRLDILGWSPQDQTGVVLPRIGFVAQDRPLYRSFKVAELLELGRRLNPHWDDGYARARLKRLGIPFDRRTGELSGGQQAQVALTMVLAKRAELLLLDEPVAGLDPLARLEFLQELMQAVADSQPSVIVSSHIVSELERTCDYLVILSRGQVQVSGPIDDLLGQHRVLVGPPVDALVERDPTVIKWSRSERQSTLLVRINGRAIGAEWESHAVTLEELVIAYMGRPERGAHPTPTLAAVDGPS